MNLFKINKILNSIVLAIFFITVYIKIEALGSGILLAGGIVYYFLYLLFMDSSRPIISKMIISRIKRGFDDNAKKVFNYYLYYSLIISAIVLIIFSIIPSTFCRVLFKDSLCASVLMACGFLFCIHAICDVLKAYYIGNGNNKLVFFSDIVKNILLLVCTFLLIKYFY